LKLSQLKIIFSDFDGTLTCQGFIDQNFIEILNWSRKREMPFVIVTGRSLSWGHFLLTHFNQVDVVIVEGGGVVVWKDEKGRLCEQVLVSEKNLDELKKVTMELEANFSFPLSQDSFGRKTDRAIELYHFDQKRSLKKEVELFLKEKGVNFSCSNVHLNFWKGDISKIKGINFFSKRFFPEHNLDNYLYFGDALNDQEVFKEFPHSVGVSNISIFLNKMSHRPKVILKGKENEGNLGVLNYLKQLSK
jgi:HAD superfamily hydrolase (TIGR01484 family)